MNWSPIKNFYNFFNCFSLWMKFIHHLVLQNIRTRKLFP
jgi:hypothetical protein